MKGLLQKEFYQLWGWWLVSLGIFLAVSTLSGTSFYAVFAILMAGMLPGSMLSQDEQCRWDSYAGALPVSRAQLVAAKYLIALILIGTAWLLACVTQAIRLGLFTREWVLYVTFSLGVGLLCPSLLLPILFKFGSTKGRVAYLIGLGALFGVVAALSVSAEDGMAFLGYLQAHAALFPLVSAALFAVSWRLSVAFYQRREL